MQAYKELQVTFASLFCMSTEVPALSNMWWQ